MSVGEAIFGKLTDDPTVSGLLGDRVYPLQAVQFSRFPLAAYEFGDSQYDQTYSGPSGLSSHAGTIACVGLTFDSAEALGNAVRTLINGQKGTWGGVTVLGCFVNDVGDALESAVETGQNVWRKDLAVTLWISES